MDFEKSFARLFRQNGANSEDHLVNEYGHNPPSLDSAYTPPMSLEEALLKRIQIQEEEAQLVSELRKSKGEVFNVSLSGRSGPSASALPTIHVHGPAVFNIACSNGFGAQAMHESLRPAMPKSVLGPPRLLDNQQRTNTRYLHRYRTISPRRPVENSGCVIGVDLQSGYGERSNKGGDQSEREHMEKCPSWLLPRLNALLPQTEGYAVVYLSSLPWAVRERVKSWMNMERRQANLRELLASERTDRRTAQLY